MEKKLLERKIVHFLIEDETIDTSGSFQDRFDTERGEIGWNEIPLTTLTRGTLDDWLMVTKLGWYVCAPVSFYLCVLRAFRAKTPRGQTDTRFPTDVSTSGCRKNGFQRGAGFFRRPDGCLFSFLFPSPPQILPLFLFPRLFPTVSTEYSSIYRILQAFPRVSPR